MSPVARDSLLAHAGRRRIEACKKLGWTEIPARIVDFDELLVENDENVHRKNFSPSEAVAISDAILERTKKEAKEKQREAGDRGKEGGRGKKKENPSENFSEGFAEENGRALNQTAKMVGMSRPTLEKARAVVEAAKENPSENFSEGFAEENGEALDQTAKIVGMSGPAPRCWRCGPLPWRWISPAPGRRPSRSKRLHRGPAGRNTTGKSRAFIEGSPRRRTCWPGRSHGRKGRGELVTK